MIPIFQDRLFYPSYYILNRSKFNRIVSKYDDDKYVKYFTCWNRLLAINIFILEWARIYHSHYYHKVMKTEIIISSTSLLFT
ncbi:DUF4372 domain-containing protein [Phocaeicola coprocola]|uniref:DUF4372 domain-containing protein n=1 Tax=Phocaeicola coprocola TaxID=310298 RepID=UPI0034A00FDE